IVAGGGLTAKRVATPVSTLDLVPTIVDLVGLPSPAGVRGMSLRPWLEGSTSPPRHPPTFFEKYRKSHALKWPPGHEMRGMVMWPYKIIWTPRFNRFQIYNLAVDPGDRV